MITNPFRLITDLQLTFQDSIMERNKGLIFNILSHINRENGKPQLSVHVVFVPMALTEQ